MSWNISQHISLQVKEKPKTKKRGFLWLLASSQAKSKDSQTQIPHTLREQQECCCFYPTFSFFEITKSSHYTNQVGVNKPDTSPYFSYHPGIKSREKNPKKVLALQLFAACSFNLTNCKTCNKPKHRKG